MTTERTSGVLVVVGVCAIAIAGCNNGGSSSPVGFGDLPQRLGAAYCGFSERCGYEANFEEYLFHSQITDCDAQAAAYFADTTFAQYQLAIDGGTLTYDASAAGACLAVFDTVGCDASALAGAPAECRRTFQGHVADGGACTLSEECSDTSTCTGSGTSCGTCVHEPQVGEACTSSGASCAEGAFCASGTCTAQVGVGGACDPSNGDACRNGLACTPNASDPTHGTCTERPTVGAGESCNSATCASGLVCAFTGTSFTCRAPRTDGTCETVLSGSDCPSGTTCNAMSGMQGSCVAFPTLGSPCTNACAAPARCVNSVCHPATRIGGSCSGDDDCISGNCDAGACAARPLCTP